MPSVHIRIPSEPAYDVRIEPGLLNEVGTIVADCCPAQKAMIVTDTAVGPLYLSTIEASLRRRQIEPIVALVPSGESHKTLATISAIMDALLPARVDRATPLLALGGGVVGDMAGFVAATLLRGVPFIQIPTTLLAMVDASVGGKTGVNHAAGKNLIGAFHQPRAVCIDPNTLKTLSSAELRSGLAECIKHEIIRDADGFTSLQQNIGRALALDVHYLSQLIAHNVAIKARVVEADPLERGERAHLNFGHTFGHAIERVFNYELSHGACVALGMCAAADCAVRLKMLDESARDQIVALIAAAQLPTSLPTLDVQQIVDAMGFDKKVASGKLRLVLADRIGHVVIRDDVPAGTIRESVESLRG